MLNLICLLIGISLARAQTPEPAPAATPASAETPAPQLSRVEGRLFERGTRRPLEGVNVFLLPHKMKATTDREGRFEFRDVPAGEAQFTVNFPGYQRLEKIAVIEASSLVAAKLFLERATYQGGLEATVVGKIAKRDDASQVLTQEKFLTLPGAGGDPVKAVQNLPGVARVAGFSSQIAIQGSAPQDTTYLFDEHEVPLVFHFGGLTSVVMPEAIGTVDSLAAGYGPEYGRAIGGVVGLRTRDPASDRQKGLAFIDTMKSGALLEGPIDEKSAYLVSGRYSYLGYVLKGALQGSSAFDLTVVPSFGDFNAVYKLKAGERDDLRIAAFYSHDELSFLFNEPVRAEPGLRGNFDNFTNFYRIIPQWKHRFEDGAVGNLSLGLGQNLVRVDAGQNYFDLNDKVVSLRGEYETKPRPSWTSYLGFDGVFDHATVSLRLPRVIGGGGVNNPISTSPMIDASVERDEIGAAPYWRNVIHLADSRWTWMPALRVDYFGVTGEIKPEPRLALRYDQDETLKYKAATGLYYQQPQPQESSPQYGNPDLKCPMAIHYTVGAEKDFRQGSSEGWVVSSNLFYRDFQNLIINSSRLITRDGALVPEVYSNEGRGRAFGAEVLVKYDAKPWSGWISYTLSRSLRTEPGQEEHVFQYDQTHNLNIVGSYELGRNWVISGRLRYVTGNPTTPVIGGVFDADNDVYFPTRGPFFSERESAFFQIDGRVDKKWIYDTWILSAYLDVLNLTNQKNSEGVRYSYDYSQKQTVNDLPILPTIGVKGEF